jgi:hypothetical protein
MIKGQLGLGLQALGGPERQAQNPVLQANIAKVAQSKLSSPGSLHFMTIQRFLSHFVDYFDCT